MGDLGPVNVPLSNLSHRTAGKITMWEEIRYTTLNVFEKSLDKSVLNKQTKKERTLKILLKSLINYANKALSDNANKADDAPVISG